MFRVSFFPKVTTEWHLGKQQGIWAFWRHLECWSLVFGHRHFLAYKRTLWHSEQKPWHREMKNKAMEVKQIWCTRCWWKKTKKLTWREDGGSVLGSINKIGFNKLRNYFSSRLDGLLAAIELNQDGSEPENTPVTCLEAFETLNEQNSEQSEK